MLGPLFFLILPFAIAGYRKLFIYRERHVYLQPGRQAFEKYRSWDKNSPWLMCLSFVFFMLIIGGPLFNYRHTSQLQDKAAIFILLPAR
jgi:hypothetical protein